MRLRRHLAWVLPAIGLAGVAAWVNALGLARLTLALRTMGSGLLLLFALPLFLFAVHTLGWSLTLSAENRRKIGLGRLLVLQTFSYGISGMLPLQTFVAEPLKMAILRDADYDREDFAASLLVDNTINGLAIFAFSGAGLLYLGLLAPGSVAAKLAALGVVASMAAVGAALVAVQKRGVFAAALGLASRIPPLRGFSARHRASAIRADAVVRGFYAGHRRAFFLAFLLHVLEKAHGVAEFWLIFAFLGIDVSWGGCFFIASVVTGLDNLLFFAQVGGMETWVSGLLTWMNLTQDSIHITAGLFRRLRFLFWAITALLLVLATRRLFAARRAR